MKVFLKFIRIYYFKLVFTTFYYRPPHEIVIFLSRKYNLLKGGDKLNVFHKYLFLISIYFVILLLLNNFLNYSIIVQIFLISFLSHMVISLYVIYSIFEIKILHEKQGSKLSLSKGKLTSNDWS